MTNPGEVLRLEARLANIEQLRTRAKRLHEASKLHLTYADPWAEATARKAIDIAVDAYWNAKGTSLEEITHVEMDAYGYWLRSHFKCFLPYENGQYYIRCPLAIAHLGLGLSVGFTARRQTCVICDRAVEECPHSRAEVYDVPGGLSSTGHCRVCLTIECREHSPDRTYRASQGIVQEDPLIHEVTITSRPAFPEARISELRRPLNELREELGPQFRKGMRVKCDRCLKACDG